MFKGPRKWLCLLLTLAIIKGSLAQSFLGKYHTRSRQGQQRNMPMDSGPIGPLDLGEQSTRFASDVYRVLSQTPGDFLIAPSSLQTLFAMLLIGAKGYTLDEIGNTFSLPTDKRTVQTAYQNQLPIFRNIKHASFSSANKIFVQQDYQILQNFSQIARESFGAEIENKDFKNGELTVREINQWVEQNTLGKIRNLLNKNQISELTRMVLINALQFKGDWEKMFNPKLTKERPFHIDATSTKNIEFMVQEMSSLVSYDEELQAKFLELPYAGGEFTMTFVLPTKKDGLPDLERNIQKLLETNRKFDRADFIVIIPKLKIEHSTDFKQVLQQLGMQGAFNIGSDFSDMAVRGQELYISQVVQKAYIEMTETGTVAAAATAAVATDRITKPTFYANHPFLFFLRENQSKTVQFIGRFTGL